EALVRFFRGAESRVLANGPEALSISFRMKAAGIGKLPRLSSFRQVAKKGLFSQHCPGFLFGHLDLLLSSANEDLSLDLENLFGDLLKSHLSLVVFFRKEHLGVF